MVVIGADTHKRNHTLVALDGQTGAVRGQVEIAASDAGSIDALRFGVGIDEDRVWAIEDCRHVSARLEGALIAAGERVIRVPAEVTGDTRKTARVVGKSDPIDPRAVALAVVRDGIESFPVAFTDPRAMEIRVLCDYRDQIVRERVRLINRLRWHLVTIAPELEAQIKPEALRGPRVCARLTRQLARLAPSSQLRVARLTLRRITEIVREERALVADLTALIQTHAPQLLALGWLRDRDRRDHHRPHRRRSALPDRRALRSARRNPRRYPPPQARPNATACTAAGDRQLNRVIHIIAISRMRTDPDTRAYVARKVAEGKTKPEAIRCLKRHLAGRIWRLLYTAETTAPTVSINLANTEIHLTWEQRTGGQRASFTHEKA